MGERRKTRQARSGQPPQCYINEGEGYAALTVSMAVELADECARLFSKGRSRAERQRMYMICAAKINAKTATFKVGYRTLAQFAEVSEGMARGFLEDMEREGAFIRYATEGDKCWKTPHRALEFMADKVRLKDAYRVTPDNARYPKKAAKSAETPLVVSSNPQSFSALQAKEDGNAQGVSSKPPSFNSGCAETPRVSAQGVSSNPQSFNSLQNVYRIVQNAHVGAAHSESAAPHAKTFDMHDPADDLPPEPPTGLDLRETQDPALKAAHTLAIQRAEAGERVPPSYYFEFSAAKLKHARAERTGAAVDWKAVAARAWERAERAQDEANAAEASEQPRADGAGMEGEK